MDSLQTLHDGQTLSPVLQQFIAIEERMNEAVQKRDASAIQTITAELNALYGQLTAEELAEIRTFVLQQNAAKRIDLTREKTAMGTMRLLGWTEALARTSAEYVPRITQETSKLIWGTLIAVPLGIYKGGQNALNTFRQSA